jgi:hypothetical protein
MIITSLTNTIHSNLRPYRVALDAVQLAHEVCTRPKGEVLINAVNQLKSRLHLTVFYFVFLAYI